MKLSIIIPVFNVELYLHKCLLSCLEQDLECGDYEIIIVDDGSTDSSLLIAQEFTEKYSNIKVYSQENSGQSVARNRGLSLAKGEYVWYVDPDDWIEPSIFQKLYMEVSNNNLDCLWFKWRRIDANGRCYVNSSDNTSQRKGTDVESGISFLNNHFGYACYSPAFWFRRQFLLDNSFFFREGVIFEDAELIPRILLKSQRVKFIPLICYNYFIRSGSSIQRVSEKKYRDLKSVIESVDNLNSLDTNGYFDRLYSSLVVLGIRLVASDMYKDYRVDFLSFLSKMSRKLVDFDKSTLNRSIIGMLRLSPNMALNVLVILRKISGR
ncbi:glycosyltransferase [Bacteroides faecichinchillae]|uniref:glycosyltransferase n=1 Tax=Bacteroides faecichinchillae TaxID=871325 RepID=UPI0035149699